MELLFIFIFLCISAGVGLLTKNRIIIELTSVISSFIVFVESINIALKVSLSGKYSSFSIFSVDALGAILLLLISCVGFVVVIYSIPYLRKETEKKAVGFTRVRQYFVLLNLFLIAMVLAISANNPIFAWISIEATTLSTAFLISFYNKPSAIEAAWKYLIINSVGLLLGFLGTLLYFTSTHSANENGFISWESLTENATQLDPLIAKIAFIFVLIGYGTKVGLAPMHTWLPDAHSKAPAPISALLSGVLLNVALVIVLRFKVITDIAVNENFTQNLLIIFGLLSILIATLVILTQKNYKRLLAYSSIENMGIMALGFGLGGIGALGAIFHMIYHSLLKSTLFLSAGTIFLTYGSTKIPNIRGILSTLPVTSVVFLLGFFAITGAPPLGVFFSKMIILSQGIETHPFVSIFALLLMAILFIGFFKHVSVMVFGKKLVGAERKNESIWLIIPPCILMGIFILLSFYMPLFLSTLINDAVKMLLI
ncbi:MAG: hydrogenase 4 subunit F [Candidatus Moraniibacteriota bacterium]|nr:MAG: hydrogenase 4 subunit F [Candidatus Moranbacteria bacterium]